MSISLILGLKDFYRQNGVIFIKDKNQHRNQKPMLVDDMIVGNRAGC